MATLDVTRFRENVSHLLDTWKSQPDLFQGAEALTVVLGSMKVDEEADAGLTGALHMWLFEYFLAETIICLTPSKVVLLVSKAKARMMEAFQGPQEGGWEVEILVRAPNTLPANLEALMQAVQGARSSESPLLLGVVEGEFRAQTGDFANSWVQTVDEKELTLVDVAKGVSQCVTHRIREEQTKGTLAGALCSALIRKVFVKSFERAIENEEQPNHSTLEKTLSDACEKLPAAVLKSFSKIKEFDPSLVERGLEPCIQSGDSILNYALGLDQRPMDGTLTDRGSFLCSLGISYGAVPVALSRTFFVSPNETQQQQYEIVLSLQEYLTGHVKVGMTGKELYQEASSWIQSKSPELAAHFQSSIGYMVGCERLTDPHFRVDADCDLQFSVGSMLCLCLSFGPMQAGDKSYAIQLADTYLLAPEPQASSGVRVTDLTSRMAKKGFEDIKYDLDEDDSEDDGLGGMAVDQPQRDYSFRSRKQFVEKTVDLEKKVLELVKKKAVEWKQLGEDHNPLVPQKKVITPSQQLYENTVYSYHATHKFGSEKLATEVVADPENRSILLPIRGTHVPFHVCTVKSVAFQDEGPSGVLRVNFNTPGQSVKAFYPGVVIPNQVFVKEVSFSSPNTEHLRDVETKVRAMLTTFRKESKIKEEEADMKKQGALMLDRKSFVVLEENVSIFPPLSSGRGAARRKKNSGRLSTHINGFRFQSVADNTLQQDILFANVRACFVFPGEGTEKIMEGTTRILLHFFLKNPIRVGDKKTMHVQFFVDVMEEEDLSRDKRMRDRDAIEAERREIRKRRMILGKFNEFAEKSEKRMGQERPGFRFDFPVHDMEFTGAVNKQTVPIFFTANCLVALQEAPFFVLPLDEVELVSLERVQSNTRSFEMIFVMKDLNQPVQRIDSVPTSKIDDIKQCLVELGIVFFENSMILRWDTVLKDAVIPQIEEGRWEPWGPDGWLSLLADTAAPDEEEEEEEEEGESEFTMSEDEDPSSEEFAEDEDEDEDEDWDGEEEVDEEDILDWDAAEEDGVEDESDSDGAPSRKRAKRGAGASSSSGFSRKGTGSQFRRPR